MIAASSKDGVGGGGGGASGDSTQSQQADELSKASCRKRLANCYIQQINLFAELCKGEKEVEKYIYSLSPFIIKKYIF